jgi:hypothetical protein
MQDVVQHSVAGLCCGIRVGLANLTFLFWEKYHGTEECQEGVGRPYGYR